MQTQVCVSPGKYIISGDQSHSPFPGIGGGTFKNRSVCPTFRQKGRRKNVPAASAVSHLPSAQNNPYAKVARFESSSLV